MKKNPLTTQSRNHVQPLAIDRVISVCARKHLDVWKFASQSVIENMKAASYEVIVPDTEVAVFKDASPDAYQVSPESLYIGRYRQLLEYMIDQRIERLGWYLQQFIKLAALEHHAQDNLLLIWDADTVPLRKLHFVAPTGKLLYYSSAERHPPYFQTIERLTELRRIVSKPQMLVTA
ncbi:MAG TPA: DUF6492 family protein [Hyphomicrobiales bacterium]|nr:DUF6492 family protein [Hyphomicrobiales bacterium]